MPTEEISDISAITDGQINIRVTNSSTGEITRHSIAVDAANDSLSDIVTDISGITGLTASITSSNKLTISADSNYTFDFSPCFLPKPTVVNFNDASPPQVSVTGLYDGTENDTFVFTVIGDGSIGNGTLQLEVRDANGAGDLIKTLNIGSGYAAGDELEIENGIKISIGMGNLAQSNGDSFSINALANSDTSGLLAATGMNTFFSGTCAKDMAVNSEISDNPLRIATSISQDMTDNNNVIRMMDVQNKAIGDLKSLTCGEFYRQMSNVQLVFLHYNPKLSEQEYEHNHKF
jgi:hypothetical protein